MMSKKAVTEYRKNWLNKSFEELVIACFARCWNCGSTYNLQFAHIKKTNLKGSGRGKRNRYFDIKKNPSCYALLCETCHRQFDKDMELLNDN